MKKLLFLFVLIACSPKAANPDPILSTSACPSACKQLRTLSCPQAAPVKMSLGQYQSFTQEDLEVTDPSGLPCSGDPMAVCIPCETFCTYQQTHGHSLNPTCLATVASCAEVSSKCHD